MARLAPINILSNTARLQEYLRPQRKAFIEDDESFETDENLAAAGTGKFRASTPPFYVCVLNGWSALWEVIKSSPACTRMCGSASWNEGDEGGTPTE